MKYIILHDQNTRSNEFSNFVFQFSIAFNIHRTRMNAAKINKKSSMKQNVFKVAMSNEANHQTRINEIFHLMSSSIVNLDEVSIVHDYDEIFRDNSIQSRDCHEIRKHRIHFT